jgi:hypothetical protein
MKSALLLPEVTCHRNQDQNTAMLHSELLLRFMKSPCPFYPIQSVNPTTHRLADHHQIKQVASSLTTVKPIVPFPL